MLSSGARPSVVLVCAWFTAVLAASSATAEAQTPDRRVPAHPDWVNTLTPRGDAAAELVLASEGETEYRILIPEKATAPELKAAADLAQWLEAMSGVEYEVVAEPDPDEGPVISVGSTRRLDRARPAGWDVDLEFEGIGIGTADRDLLIWGGSTRGVIDAVYAFLEEDLGCRWYHRDTATIPDRPELRVRPVPRTFVPVLEIRDPFYWDAFHSDWSIRNRTNSPSASVPDEWGGCTRYAGGFFVHTYNQLVPPGTYFESHPEYYSEINGKRVPHQLCLSNPDVTRIAIAKVREVLAADPEAQLISVSPNDGLGYCECAECMAFDEAEGGTRAGTLLRFVNEVADAIRDDFPHVKVTTLAYLDTVRAPRTVRPRENVVIRLCTDAHAWSHFFEFVTETDPFSEAMRDWSEIGAKIHIWDYTVNFSHYSLPSPNMPLVTQNVRWMMAHNARGIMLQGAYQGPGSARGPLRSWVWAKQLWDPDRNTRDLIRDFTYGFYGSAAGPLQAYQDLLWRLWEREYMGALRQAGNIRYPPDSAFLTPEFAREATALFAEAEDLADTPETLRRVQLAKFPLLYLKLCRGPGFVEGEDYGHLCTEFESIAAAEEIKYLWEDWNAGADHVPGRLRQWRNLVEALNAEFQALPIGPDCLFRPDPDRVGHEEQWYAVDFPDLAWTRMRCDQEQGWSGQGFADLTGDGWYRIRFSVPAEFGERQVVRVFFGAADEDAEVFLNGEKVFEHTCESTGLTPAQLWTKPFQFDPGPHLKRGAENLLCVRVHNSLGWGGLYKPLYLLVSEEEVDPAIVLDAMRLQAE